ncbi:hypothetical protein AKJ50_01730 [candidate division MSBL1 archaeon SCGC-AAA382A13]|uniref:Formylmethanofuran dehydrogenase subunit E domain-containing protein n=1 Tax=candidate division MSBL1 archaeon SCGC-AAA382A13 TaxID=1698279 RepID=A0A133VFF2_9EURY|nr:hypothetical protein AKJ50_01730 [candidate division MSBL1 archaeon SCGC-AAA382A13]
MRIVKNKEEILNRLTDFHGHLGPYVVVGCRMGMIANNELGDDPFEKKAVVETGIGPPLSCIVDGVQFSSGCTLGKGNLEIKDKGEPKVIFSAEEKSVSITLREKTWKKIDNVEDEILEQVSREIFDASSNELFHIETKDSEFSEL